MYFEFLIYLNILGLVPLAQFHKYLSKYCIKFDFFFLAVNAIICNCSTCPEYFNDTCELRPGGMCFASVEQEGDGSETWTYGCLAPVDEEGGMILQVTDLSFMHFF